MSKTALLLVDVQYDFLPGGSLAVSKGDEILPVIHKLLKNKWDFVVASQDYHPNGHVSFASTHSREPFVEIDVPHPYPKEGEPSTIRQMLWPDHCVQGTRGCEIESSVLEALKPWIDSGKGLIVQKGADLRVDAYSAFANPTDPYASPSGSPLTDALRAQNVGTLDVVGLATDYCVRASALDARKAGFNVRLIREGMRAVGGDEATARVEEELKAAGVEVL